MLNQGSPTRRPIGLRQTRLAADLATLLLRVGLRPNQISILSVVFAALAGSCLVLGAAGDPVTRAVLSIAAAGFIGLRMLCNLLDGMVAIEGGLQTKSGVVFNDLPDRFSDAIILVSAGYAISGVAWARELGWLTGMLALLTAYVRLLGGSAGLPQNFSGPMAKPHRMYVMALACLLAGLGTTIREADRVLLIALVSIAVGCVVTIVGRTRRMVSQLEAQ